jgi:hypothetical protein
MKYQNLVKSLLSYGLALFLLTYGFIAQAQQPTVRKAPYRDNALRKTSEAYL